jgi:hypothetical protein
MAERNCRENPSRKRPRLRVAKTPAGSTDTTMAEALVAFREATGRDFETDAELHALLAMLKTGLDDAEKPAAQRTQRPPKRVGAPALPEGVTAAVHGLVDLLGGPTEAAIAVMLGRLHVHPGFISARRRPGLGFDVREHRRAIGQRLSAIAASYVPAALDEDMRAAGVPTAERLAAGSALSRIDCTDFVPTSLETGTPGGTP